MVEATLHLTDEVTGEIWSLRFGMNIVRSPGKMGSGRPKVQFERVQFPSSVADR